MANKEASIKVTLDNQQFIVSVRGLVSEAEKGGSKIGSGLEGGFKRGHAAVSRLFSSVTSLVGMGAVLGGAFSLKEGLSHALDMDTRYRDIARQIRQLTGNSTTLAEAQETVAQASKHTTVSVAELSDAYLAMLKETGNADFSKAALSAASQEATRTGKSFADMSDLAGKVFRKFEIAPEKIGATLRMITANTDIGGPKLDELSSGFDMLGAVAESGGMKGEAGLSLLLGMLNKTAPVLGRFSESSRAMNGVFSALQAPEAFNKIRQMTAGTDSGFVKKLINAPDALARLDMILQKGGTVRKEFEKAITDRKEVALYKILTEPFDKSVADAMKSGKKGAAAMEEGSAAFKASLEGLTRAGDSKAAADEELAKRMATNKAQLDQAMKELEEAFSKPEVVSALKGLIGVLPPVVNAFTALLGAIEKVVSWVSGGITDYITGATDAATEAQKDDEARSRTAAPVTAQDVQDYYGMAPSVPQLGPQAYGPGAYTAQYGPQPAMPEFSPAFAPAKPRTEVSFDAIEAFSAKATNYFTTPAQQDIGAGTATAAASVNDTLDKLREAQTKQIMKVERSAEVHDVLIRSVNKAANALDRLGTAAGGAGAGATTGEGVSKGPGRPSGGGPGFDWDKYG